MDGGKKIKGRKSHIITDTSGLLLAVEIHAANEHDSKAAFRVIKTLNYRFERMKKIYADGGYRGELAEKVKNKFKQFLNFPTYPLCLNQREECFADHRKLP